MSDVVVGPNVAAIARAVLTYMEGIDGDRLTELLLEQLAAGNIEHDWGFDLDDHALAIAEVTAALTINQLLGGLILAIDTC